MKRQTGIWIDSAKAILVTITDENEHVEEIVSDVENRMYHDHESDKGSFAGGQHINKDAKFDERRNHQMKQFINTVSDKIKDHDAVFVFGPAETKTKLKKHFEQDSKLAGKLKAVEAAEKMTMNQVTAKVREFFKANE